MACFEVRKDHQLHDALETRYVSYVFEKEEKMTAIEFLFMLARNPDFCLKREGSGFRLTSKGISWDFFALNEKEVCNAVINIRAHILAKELSGNTDSPTA